MKKIILSLIYIFLSVCFINAQDWIYAKQFSSSGNVTPVDIVVGSDDNIYLAGIYTESLTIGTTTLPYSDLNSKEDIFLCSFAANGDFRWARQIASDHADEFGGIAIDNSNNVYVVGDFKGSTLAFPPSATTLTVGDKFDVFLAKYNSDGDLIFADSIFWGTGAQRLKDVAVDFSNNRLVLIGNFTTELKYYDGVDVQTITMVGDDKDHILALYDLSGNYINIQTYVSSVKQTEFKSVNNCVFSGDVQGYFVGGDLVGKLYLPGNDTLKGDEATMDAMVLKFDNNLSYKWSRRGGGTSFEHVNSAARDNNGNVYIAGKCQSSTMTFDSTETLQSNPLPTLGGMDMYIASYNRDLDLRWIRRCGGTDDDNAYGLAVKGSLVNTAGNIYYNGTVNTGFSLWDVGGNKIACDSIDGDGIDQGQGVAFGPAGDSIYVIGYFTSTTLNAGGFHLTNTVAGNQDGFLVKYGYKFSTYLENKTNVSCNGGSDGYIKVGTRFGAQPISYAWTPDVSDSSEAVNLTAGTYKIVATSAGDKKDSVNVTVTQPSAITITTNLVKDASCYEGSDGEIRIWVSGGTLPHTLTWAGPGSLTQGDSVQTGLVAGSYSLDVEDGNGCTAHEDFEVGQASQIIFYGSVVDTIKNPPGCNGAVHLGVSGGTPDYSVLSWTGPSGYSSTEDTITGLCYGGNYTVEVTDANLCVQDTSFNVPSDTSLNIVICEKTNITCKGDYDGYAKVCVTFGGTGSYSYAWRTSGGSPVGGNSPELPDVYKGTYYVKVTDLGNSRTAETSVKIEEPTLALSPYFNEIRHISCYGETDGYIDLEISGGWGGYTYLWVPGNKTTQDVSNLTAGTKIVTVTDAGNCIKQLETTIIEPSQMNVTISVYDSISCYGGSDGALEANPAGGTGPYTFSWDDDGTQNDSIASGLYARLYTVTVTDSKGCEVLKSKNLLQPVQITINSADASDVTCYNGSNGSVSVDASGGTGTLIYTISPGDSINTSGTFMNLPEGDYTVQVSDNNGCLVNSSTLGILDNNLPINILTDEISSQIRCFGLAEAEIVMLASGGAGTLQYSVDDGVSFSDEGLFTGIGSGNYITVVRDANGCLKYGDTLEVTDPPELIITSIDSTDISCFGEGDGEIIITASGGTGTILYSKNGGTSFVDNSGSFTGLAQATYTIVVKDANECITQGGTVTINEATAIQIVRIITDVSCSGGNDGSIDITPSGGTSPYTFSWSHGPATEDVSGLTDGNFTVTVTDANSCTQDSIFTVTESAQLIFVSILIDSTSHADSVDGVITLTAGGGTEPYHYFLDGTEELGHIFNDLDTGNYIVRIDDANDCSTGDSTVFVPYVVVGGIRSVFEFGELLIYPNPTTGQITVEIENRDHKDITLEIINLSGQLIWKKELQYNGQPGFIEVIDMSQQAHGTYFIRVNGLPVNTKIILE